MRYHTGGFSDFLEAVLRGAAKGAVDDIEKPDKKKDADKSTADKAVDAVKGARQAVDKRVKEEKTKAITKYVVMGVLVYLLLKGRR